MEEEMQQAVEADEGAIKLVRASGDAHVIAYHHEEGLSDATHQHSVEIQHITRQHTLETEQFQQQSVQYQQTLSTEDFISGQASEVQRIIQKQMSVESSSSEHSAHVQERVLHSQSVEVQHITDHQAVVSRQTIKQEAFDVTSQSQVEEQEAGKYIVKHTTTSELSGATRLTKQDAVDAYGQSFDQQLAANSTSLEQKYGLNSEQWRDSLQDAWQQVGIAGSRSTEGNPELINKQEESNSSSNSKEHMMNGKGFGNMADSCMENTQRNESLSSDKGIQEDSATESVTLKYAMKEGNRTSESSSESSFDAIGSPKSDDNGPVFKFSHWTPTRTQSVRHFKVRTKNEVARTTSLGGENEPRYSTMEHQIRMLKGDA